MKRLLTGVYIYLGAFGAAVLALNACGIKVQDSIIAGICAGIGIESLAGGIIKINEEICAHRIKMQENKLVKSSQDAPDIGK